VLYAPYRAVAGSPLGLSPLADQHFAAWLMTVEQALVLGGFLVFLFQRERSGLRDEADAPVRLEHGPLNVLE
jgi:hypothetical protein